MKILVTGGAGYIGSHVVKKLLEKNYQVLVVDNFSTGFIEPLEILRQKYPNLEIIKADLGDKDRLKDILTKNKPEAVMHLAAKIDVSESVERPELYYQENYINSVNLVEAMTEAGVNKLIFSSTAAVYGDPAYTPVDENHPTKPLNPYGQTKLDFEKYLAKCQDLKYVVFRYFNVGGSDQNGLLGKSHLRSQDLIENIIKTSLNQREFFEVFGADYETPDGTAIRDFISVEDVAAAHILALEKIDSHCGEIFNLGSSKGFSVKEMLEKAEKIIGQKINTKFSPRRPGDLSVSVASAQKAKTKLGWNPQNSNLNDIISSDYHWRSEHPFGYTK